MLKPMRILSVLMGILLLFLALSVGNASTADAAKPQTPTPGPTPTLAPIPPGLRAGLRASNYGISPFPSPNWWVSSINSMASRFPGSVGEQIAVVVEVAGGGGRTKCWAHFPQPATGTWPNVNWDDIDLFESTFDAFDAAGIKVWLQVEPARCEVPMLIDLLMQQYGHHPSVIGFGVDVEWYRKDLAKFGKPVTDVEAQAWVNQTRSYNASYLVFLKHWLTEKMPPTARDGLVFIDDSQGHGSLSAMVNEFSIWGQTFAPAPVGFQYGYQSDQSWWSNLSDPPREIGNGLLAARINSNSCKSSRRFSKTCGTIIYRLYSLFSSCSLPASSLLSSSGLIRHSQLPPSLDGKFIRASVSKLKASCIGVIA